MTKKMIFLDVVAPFTVFQVCSPVHNSQYVFDHSPERTPTEREKVKIQREISMTRTKERKKEITLISKLS